MSGLTGSPCYDLLSCSPPLQETFTSGLSTARSPSPLPDMTTVATGQFPPAGLTPAGPTTSVAAQLPPPHLTLTCTVPGSEYQIISHGALGICCAASRAPWRGQIWVINGHAGGLAGTGNVTLYPDMDLGRVWTGERCQDRT